MEKIDGFTRSRVLSETFLQHKENKTTTRVHVVVQKNKRKDRKKARKAKWYVTLS